MLHYCDLYTGTYSRLQVFVREKGGTLIQCCMDSLFWDQKQPSVDVC